MNKYSLEIHCVLQEVNAIKQINGANGGTISLTDVPFFSARKMITFLSIISRDLELKLMYRFCFIICTKFLLLCRSVQIVFLELQRILTWQNDIEYLKTSAS